MGGGSNRAGLSSRINRNEPEAVWGSEQVPALPLSLWGLLESYLTSPWLCVRVQSCLTLCNPLDCSPPGSSVHGDSPGKNIGVGCHALLQGISPIQGSNSGLPHCRQILYHVSHQGSKIEIIREDIQMAKKHMK